MMTSKAEYLKRYMSDEPVAKKKKKEKRLVVGKSRYKLIFHFFDIIAHLVSKS